MKLLCYILNHKPNIHKVELEHGFPANRSCYCVRCRREGTWIFSLNKYHLLWSVK